MLVIRLLLSVTFICSCYGWNLYDLIVPHFGSSVKPKCQRYGQQCKFDRHCCAGLECRIGGQDYNIGFFCHKRLVENTYVEFTGGPSWKDYQEPNSDLSEDEGAKSLNVEELCRRNEELQRKLAELKLLRKKVRQQQLKDVKKRLEEVEIELLKDEKKKYEEKKNQEMKKLREKEIEDNLMDMEKEEVNRTLSKQNKRTDDFMDILV